jgi:putative transposase
LTRFGGHACRETTGARLSRSGCYDWASRAPSSRAIRHAWLTDVIGTMHQASRETYGAPRVHAELVHGYGIVVGHNTVSLLMRRAALAGLPARSRGKRIRKLATVTDLVRRDFRRTGPNQLWVTDITEHPTREGKVYCCVVATPGHGGSSAGPSTPPSAPAWPPARWAWRPGSRSPAAGGIIHGDHGTQFTSWTFAERARKAGLLPSLGSVGDPYDNAVAESFWGRMHRAAQPAALGHPPAASQRDLRIHRRLPQPPTAPLRARPADPARVRKHRPSPGTGSSDHCPGNRVMIS